MYARLEEINDDALATMIAACIKSHSSPRASFRKLVVTRASVVRLRAPTGGAGHLPLQPAFITPSNNTGTLF